MIKDIFEIVAPTRLAFDKDPIGLQIGTWNAQVDKLLVSLDVNEQVVDEAISIGAQMIFCHHAIFYKPISKIIVDSPEGRIINKIIKNNISIYVAHTNLDIVDDGVNDVLVNSLGLEEIDILQTTKIDNFKKLVVFVPKSHHQLVLNAINDAGAGSIGDYSHCSFNVAGMGTFMPLEGSSPYIGDYKQVSEVDEIRIETIIDDTIQTKVISAMLAAHPYEEVAYDIYNLEMQAKKYGIGRIGNYKTPILLSEFMDKVKKTLNLSVLQTAGISKETIKRVAVCGGSGAKLISSAKSKNADVFLTGDVSYHDAQWAADNGLILINAGHYQTERLIVPIVTKKLKELFDNNGLDIEVIASEINTDPFQFM